MNTHPPSRDHFQGKKAIQHVIEAQARGIINQAESHGVEPPSMISFWADATKETAITLILIFFLLQAIHVPFEKIMILLIIFSIGWLLWKSGRSAWIAWSRLERLDNVLEEEKWEIEHHRDQERDELSALYAAKGLEGELLERVIDVLMADETRLLKVMLEEELGLSLGSQEHPLKVSLGALLGVLTATISILLTGYFFQNEGFYVGAFCSYAAATAFIAKVENNKVLPALIWNLGIAVAVIATFKNLLHYIQF